MRLRRASLVAALAAATAVTVAVTTASAAPTPSYHPGPGKSHKPAPTAGKQFDHLFVIMLENHSKSSVIDDANAPYLTSLAHKYSMADNYYGVTHPSMPNYIATIAGDNYGIQDDNDQNVVNLNRVNLVDQLESHHISWDAYMDTLPTNKLDRFGPTVDGAQVPLYAKKHDPFVLFDDIKNNPQRMSHVRAYTDLKADLNTRSTPQFVWITPNQCNDMHGGVYSAVAGHPETPCAYGDVKDDALKQKADIFVHGAVNTITHSRAWTKKSAIVILTDEDDFTGETSTGGWESPAGCCDSPYVSAGDPRISASWPGGTYGGGIIPAIVVTANGPRHYVDHTPYNHYSLLTTIEDNWRLGHIGHAGDVRPMWPAFTGHQR